MTDAQFGVGQGRVVTVDSKNPGNLPQPESEQIGQPDNTPDETFVQPPYGAGPKFFSGSIDHIIDDWPVKLNKQGVGICQPLFSFIIIHP